MYKCLLDTTLRNRYDSFRSGAQHVILGNGREPEICLKDKRLGS